MKKKLQILVALAAGVVAIAIGQRTQNNDTRQRDTRTQKAQVEGVDDAEHWFV